MLKFEHLQEVKETFKFLWTLLLSCFESFTAAQQSSVDRIAAGAGISGTACLLL